MPDTELSSAVKKAFESVRSSKEFPSQDPLELPSLSQTYLARVTRSVFDELDMHQLAVTRRLTPTQRLRQVSEINRTLRKLVAASIRNQHPDISADELNWRVAQRIGGTYEL
jgi:hypothetical protein